MGRCVTGVQPRVDGHITEEVFRGDGHWHGHSEEDLS